MPSPTAPRAVLFDAYGTLLFLDDPVGRLAGALAERGWPNDRDDVARAFAAEVAHYRGCQDRGRDAASLDELRQECAAVLASALPRSPPTEVAAAALATSLAYRLYDDVLPALDRLAAGGCRLGVVSNWDASLPEVLERLGIADRFAVVAASALVGARKPAAEIFLHATRALGVAPAQAVHVGNDAVLDYQGARAAGLAAILVERTGDGGDLAAVTSLSQVACP